MKAIARFFHRLLGILSARQRAAHTFHRLLGKKRYMYYVVIVKEAFRTNEADNHDTYVSGYLFRSRSEAEDYAEWLVSSTVLYDSALVECLPSDLHMMCARLVYPRRDGDKLEPVFVEPIPRA